MSFRKLPWRGIVNWELAAYIRTRALRGLGRFHFTQATVMHYSSLLFTLKPTYIATIQQPEPLYNSWLDLFTIQCTGRLCVKVIVEALHYPQAFLDLELVWVHLQHSSSSSSNANCIPHFVDGL